MALAHFHRQWHLPSQCFLGLGLDSYRKPGLGRVGKLGLLTSKADRHPLDAIRGGIACTAAGLVGETAANSFRILR